MADHSKSIAPGQGASVYNKLLEESVKPCFSFAVETLERAGRPARIVPFFDSVGRSVGTALVAHVFAEPIDPEFETENLAMLITRHPTVIFFLDEDTGRVRLVRQMGPEPLQVDREESEGVSEETVEGFVNWAIDRSLGR